MSNTEAILFILLGFSAVKHYIDSCVIIAKQRQLNALNNLRNKQDELIGVQYVRIQILESLRSPERKA